MAPPLVLKPSLRVRLRTVNVTPVFTLKSRKALSPLNIVEFSLPINIVSLVMVIESVSVIGPSQSNVTTPPALKAARKSGESVQSVMFVSAWAKGWQRNRQLQASIQGSSLQERRRGSKKFMSFQNRWRNKSLKSALNSA